MKEEQEHDLLNRWLKGEIDENEVSQLLSVEQIQKYKQILNSVDQLIPTNESFVFDPKLVTTQPKVTKTRTLNWWIPISAAASFLVLMLIGLYYFEDSNTSYQTAFGEKITLTLPDQTTSVVLAANSEIQLDQDDWASGQRNLILTGQAYFDVTQKGAFQVSTTLGAVNVLGTRFDVVSHEDWMEVKCYEGIVSITIGKEPALILNAGEGSLYHQNHWEAKQILTENEPSWIAKLETFSNAPLKQVLKYLNAQYNVNFDIEAINIDRRFTGTVPDDNLNLALKIVFSSLEIQYEQKDDFIILSE